MPWYLQGDAYFTWGDAYFVPRQPDRVSGCARSKCVHTQLVRALYCAQRWLWRRYPTSGIDWTMVPDATRNVQALNRFFIVCVLCLYALYRMTVGLHYVRKSTSLFEHVWTLPLYL